MRRGQRGRNFTDYIAYLHRRQGATLFQNICQGAAIDIFHCNVISVIYFAPVIDADDVGMI